MEKKGQNKPIGETLQELYELMLSRKASMGEESYVALLYRKGEDSILKKIAEEAGEVLIAAKGGTDEKLVYEMVDLWFHCMVLMAHREIDLDDIAREFVRREGKSGLEEKASRKKG